MTTGYVEKSVELQIADIVHRALNEKFPGAMNFGPTRVKEEDDLDGELYLHIYTVCDGKAYMLDPIWTSMIPRHIEPELRAIGVTQRVIHSFVGDYEWDWFRKAAGLDC